MRIRDKFGCQISCVHGPAIPLQPEPELLLLSHPLLSNDLDDDPFGALPIEFAGEEARPATKVNPAIGDGQDDLVMRASDF